MAFTARIIDLSGLGPFQLPTMQSVVSAGEGSWETPILRLQTERGAEVVIPIHADAMFQLRGLAQAGCMLPQNPANDPKLS